MTNPQTDIVAAYLKAKTRAVHVGKIVTGVLLVGSLAFIVWSVVVLANANTEVGAAQTSVADATTRLAETTKIQERAASELTFANMNLKVVEPKPSSYFSYNVQFQDTAGEDEVKAAHTRIAIAKTAFDNATLDLTASQVVMAGFTFGLDYNTAAVASAQNVLIFGGIGTLVAVLVSAVITYALALSAARARATFLLPSPVSAPLESQAGTN